MKKNIVAGMKETAKEIKAFYPTAVDSLQSDIRSLVTLTLLERFMHLVTLLVAMATILLACKWVVQVNNQLFSVFMAVVIGAWLWVMYRKVL